MRRSWFAIPGLILAATGVACTNSPVSPSPSNVRRPLLLLSERLETVHFLFFYSPGDRIEVDRLEAYHRWATAYLSVTVPRRIEYYKYRQLEDAFCADTLTAAECLRIGAGGMSNTSLLRIYTSEPYHPHECFHIYTRQIGSPPTFFNEGMATAHIVDPFNNDFAPRAWSYPGSEPLADVARRYYAAGRLVPVETLLTGNAWGQAPADLTYPEAGSFVRFLIDAYGLEPMKEVFRVIPYTDPPEVILTKFEGIYGMSLRAAEAEWHDVLAGVRPE